MRPSHRCKTCGDLLHESDLYKHYFTCTEGIHDKDNRMQADPDTILENYERPRLTSIRQKGYTFIETILVIVALLILAVTVLALGDYETLPTPKETIDGITGRDP